MNRYQKFLLPTAFAGLSLGAQLAGATIIAGNSGLASAETTLTFNEIVLTPGTIMTNQYAGFGVTFSDGVQYDDPRLRNVFRSGVEFGTVSGHSLSNLAVEGQRLVPVASLFFTDDLSSASFGFANDRRSDIFVKALLNGQIVDSATVPGSFDNCGTAPACFIGLSIRITDLVFDQIQLSTDNRGAINFLDNVQFNRATAVPEPASVALFGIGFAGLGFLHRKQAARENANLFARDAEIVPLPV